MSGKLTSGHAVRIEATDREGLERLIRYCAGPPADLHQSPEFDPADPGPIPEDDLDQG